MQVFNKSTATLKDSMGDDLTVVNAARVSFGKQSELVDGNLKEGDKSLLAFLARENHVLPFAHAQISFHVQAPIFVARQLVKHQVGAVWSEMSYRYIKPIGAYLPDVWRAAAENKKQGSIQDSKIEVGQTIDGFKFDPVLTSYSISFKVYDDLLDKGVCPEQARMVLPLSTMTEFTWTGSLLFWSRVCDLRIAPDAQKETREVAEQISEQIEPLFPQSWKVLGHGLSKEIHTERN